MDFFDPLSYICFFLHCYFNIILFLFLVYFQILGIYEFK